MHYWGDTWPYWSDLYEAEAWINKFFFRATKGKLYLMSKEKYGVIKYDGISSNGMLYYIDNPFTGEPGLYRATIRYGWELLSLIIDRALKKWPHLKDEILTDFAAHEEYAGKVLHNIYWRKYDKAN